MYDPSIHHRRSIRLKDYDYRTPGAYVATICTHHWVSIFATIEHGEALLTPSGEMIQATWEEIPGHYPGVDVDAFVVMPNHVHGIVVLIPDDADLLTSSRLSLPDVIYRFKSLTTKRYSDGVKEAEWTPFEGRLWHRNYFERVVRDEQELDRFRQYIEDNPAAWDKDQHNPKKIG